MMLLIGCHSQRESLQILFGHTTHNSRKPSKEPINADRRSVSNAHYIILKTVFGGGLLKTLLNNLEAM
jgi:hypothetical protein